MVISKKDLESLIKLAGTKRLTRTVIANEMGVSQQTAKIYKAIYDNLGTLQGEQNKARNILVIGDLHAPFILDGYLEFCKSIYDKYNCNEVVFIGDIVDNHYSSYHETDPDGHSAAKELELAKEQINEFYKTFPIAKVTSGNHDQLQARKLMSAGISATWMRSIKEVLEVPGWEFGEEFIIDNVLYTHGTGRKAKQRAKADLTSVVQGHYHSESYIEHFVGMNLKMFALQLGCGVDRKAYAMAYGKHFNKPHINCGVVLNNGKLPILEYMDL